jgi:hypothetical protein
MGVGQRALYVFCLVLLMLIFLVIYLDGGLDHEPFVFFILLWVLDLSFLVTIFWRCIKYYNLCGAQEDAVFISELPKLNIRQTAFASGMYCQVTTLTTLFSGYSLENGVRDSSLH